MEGKEIPNTVLDFNERKRALTEKGIAPKALRPKAEWRSDVPTNIEEARSYRRVEDLSNLSGEDALLMAGENRLTSREIELLNPAARKVAEAALRGKEMIRGIEREFSEKESKYQEFLSGLSYEELSLLAEKGDIDNDEIDFLKNIDRASQLALRTLVAFREKALEKKASMDEMSRRHRAAEDRLHSAA